MYRVRAYTVNRTDLIAYGKPADRQVLTDEKVFRINAGEKCRPLLKTHDNLLFYAYLEDLQPVGTIERPDAIDQILGGVRLCCEHASNLA